VTDDGYVLTYVGTIGRGLTRTARAMERMMRTLRKSATRFMMVLLVVALPLAAAAQSVEPEQVGLSSQRLQRIQEFVQRYIDSGDIAGAVTLVARNGQIAHLEAQGMADVDSDTPMQKDHIFRLASMSKPVAGVAILMLVEEGKVRLADPVSKFLSGYGEQEVAVVTASSAPGGSGFGGPPPEFYSVPAEREITVLDLLTHTSGLMSGRVGSSETRDDFESRHDVGLAWVDDIASAPLEFQPGSRWAYSAVGGFDVLSRIVEVASGQDFDEFLNERIFEPLGMQDIFFWPNAVQRERLVTSYPRGEQGLEPRDNPDSMSGARYFSGAGGLMSTASAYAQFAMMLANGGALNGTRLLSPRTVELMGSAFIPDTLEGRSAGEGYGLSVRVVSDPVARRSPLSEGSFGWSGAYGTHFWADPKENLVGVLMIQTPVREMRPDFENAVMQSVVD